MSQLKNNNNNNTELKTIGHYLLNNNNNNRQELLRLKDQIFLTEGKTGKQLKYGQLENDAHSLAIALINEYKLKLNDICCILSDSCIEYAIFLTACHLLNIPYTSISPAIGPYMLGRQINFTNSKYLFISNEQYYKLKQTYCHKNYEYLRDKLQIILIDNDKKIKFEKNSKIKLFDELILKYKNKKLSSIPYYYDEKINTIDDVVTIVFTSGSTGLPKGACHSHQTLLTNAIEMKESESLAKYRHKTMLLTFPLGHVSGNCVFLAAYVSQTPIVLLNYNEIDSIFDVIKKYQCIQIFGSATVANKLAKNDSIDKKDIPSIKMLLTSGCKLSPNTAETLEKKYGIQIIDAYGCTECLYVSVNTKPLPSFELKLVDIDGKKELNNSNTSRKLGEICLRGPCIFREYYNLPDETKNAFDDDGWFHTGDIGFIDDDGCINITDRLKEIIKYKSYSIFPAEVENFLLTHDDITGAVVIGVKHIEYYQVLRAYVTIKPESSITVEQLLQYVNDYLGYRGESMKIGGIKIIDQLKYNQMGKIDRMYFKNLSADEILDDLE